MYALSQYTSLTIRQTLHDEINTLQLELGQIEERNKTLTSDNAKLLQRWLDAKQAEANKINDENDLYEDVRSRNENVLNWRNAGDNMSLASHSNVDARSTSGESGKGEAGGWTAATVKDGTRSPPDKKLTDQTQNG